MTKAAEVEENKYENNNEFAAIVVETFVADL